MLGKRASRTITLYQRQANWCTALGCGAHGPACCALPACSGPRHAVRRACHASCMLCRAALALAHEDIHIGGAGVDSNAQGGVQHAVDHQAQRGLEACEHSLQVVGQAVEQRRVEEHRQPAGVPRTEQVSCSKGCGLLWAS